MCVVSAAGYLKFVTFMWDANVWQGLNVMCFRQKLPEALEAGGTVAHHAALVVANVEIVQDAQGRYNLNGLWRASGGLDKDKPSNWVDLEKTAALVAAYKSQRRDLTFDAIASDAEPLVVIHGGNASGTWAVEELAVAYAAWISAAFHLIVLRAYLDRAKGNLPISGAQALRIIADQLDAHGIEIAWVKNEFCLFQAMITTQVVGVATKQDALEQKQERTHNNVIAINRRLYLDEVEAEKRRKAYQKSKQRQGPADLYKVLWEWQGGCCVMCNEPMNLDRNGGDLDAEIDEIVEVADDGWRTYDNTQLLHKKPCHDRKKRYEDLRTASHIHAARAKQQRYVKSQSESSEKKRRMYEAQNKLWDDID